MSLSKYESIPEPEYIKKVFFNWPRLNPGDILQMTLTKDGVKSTDSVVIQEDQMGDKGRFYVVIRNWKEEETGP